MLHLIGQPAFSAFRIEKLLRGLRAELPEVTGLRSEYHYFAEMDGDGRLADAALDILKTLLVAKQSDTEVQADETLLLVTPRPGTISPWSSKATDIVHNSGLTEIQRVERGIAFFVQSAKPLTGTQQQLIAGQLHDRMIETVFDNVDDAEQLFMHSAPRPLLSVDIL
ncbi:MAG: phosphoribosylformylglycinamidine synthase, partial [Methylophaga sp.]